MPIFRRATREETEALLHRSESLEADLRNLIADLDRFTANLVSSGTTSDEGGGGNNEVSP